MAELSARQRAAAGAAAVAAAVLVVTPITAAEERYVPRARPDPAHVQTYCYGETEHVDLARIYSKDECMHLLRVRLGRDYAPKILACLPQFYDVRRKSMFAAFIDASYNAGPSAVCGSRMAATLRAGDEAGACEAFVGWYVTATKRDAKGNRIGKPFLLNGLVKRRRDVERPLCLSGVLPSAPRAPTPADYPLCVTVVPGPLRPPTKPVLYPHNSQLS